MKTSHKHLLLYFCIIATLLACNLLSSSGAGEPAQTPSVPGGSVATDEVEVGEDLMSPTSTVDIPQEGNTESLTPTLPSDMVEVDQSGIDVQGLPLAFVATGWAVKGAGREIFLTNPEGSDIVSVSNSRENDIDPAWSWDGKRIAFASKREGDYEIYMMDANGGNQTRLTNHPGSDAHPAWSPDGSRIAFISDRDGNAEIYVMGADGSDPQRLTERSSPEDYPAWSPDGSSIAFSSFGGDDGSGIFVMDASGSHVRLLAAGPLHSPAWSPDGKWIALDGSPNDCKFEVYVMRQDGSDLQAITSHPDGCGGYNKHPTWSPDGDWIAFWSMRGEQNIANLYKVRPDGTGETQITFSENNPDLYHSPHDPAWSPTQEAIRSDRPEFDFSLPPDWQSMSDLWPDYQLEENYKNLGLKGLASVTSVRKRGEFGMWFTVAKTSLTTGDLQSLIDQTYAQTVPAIEKVSENTITVDNLTGFEITYRRPWGEPWWEFRDIWLEKDGNVYVLSFEALALEKYQDAMDSIIASFSLK
jgi:dipeptidyl aminopeptidase/acylaminoacyl peptidase